MCVISFEIAGSRIWSWASPTCLPKISIIYPSPSWVSHGCCSRFLQQNSVCCLYTPHLFTHSAWLCHHSLLDFIIPTILYLQWCYVLSWGKQCLIFQRTVPVPPSTGSRCSKKPLLVCMTMKTYPMTQHNIPEDLNLQQHQCESLKHHNMFNNTHILLNDCYTAIQKYLYWALNFLPTSNLFCEQCSQTTFFRSTLALPLGINKS